MPPLGYRPPRTLLTRPWAGGAGNVRIEVRGLARASRVPDLIYHRYEQMMWNIGSRLVEHVRLFVPGAPMGRIGRTVHSFRTSRDRILIRVGHRRATALNYGFVAKPTRRKAIRFVTEEGRVVFTMRAHVKGRFFWERARVGAPGIVRKEYDRFFHNLHRPRL